MSDLTLLAGSMGVRLPPAVGVVACTLRAAADADNNPQPSPAAHLNIAPQLVLTPARWPLVAEWLEFLGRPAMKGTVSKDTWLQLLTLRASVAADLSDYEAVSDAWPVLLDDFVDYARAKKARA